MTTLDDERAAARKALLALYAERDKACERARKLPLKSMQDEDYMSHEFGRIHEYYDPRVRALERRVIDLQLMEERHGIWHLKPIEDAGHARAALEAALTANPALESSRP